MSLYPYNSDEDEARKNSNYHDFDELVPSDEIENASKPSDTFPGHKSRHINVILDHSAFVRGIGNIKRWFNQEYVKTHIDPDSDEEIYLNIYIPSYTLHEFDYVKKGTSMMATNAREAIRFIDKIFEKELNGEEETDTTNPDSKPGKKPIIYDLYIESPNESGPSWSECLNYKAHSPKIKEFPNFKTKFDSNLIGQHPLPQGESLESHNNFDETNYNNSSAYKQNNKLNDIQYENSQSYQNALANADELAEMPTRLRYLIRSCIYKRFIERRSFSSPLEEWKLVTEDPITKVWAKSFGIDCMNVNEAELLIFQSYDINQYQLYDPRQNFSVDDESHAPNSILQNTIDTTLYSYTKIDRPSKSKNKNKNKNAKKSTKPKQIKGVVNDGCTGANGDFVKKERFDAINYAPRGTGELWKP